MDDDCPPPPPVQHTSAEDDDADLDDSRRLTAVADISSSLHCDIELEVPALDHEHSISPVLDRRVNPKVVEDAQQSQKENSSGPAATDDCNLSSAAESSTKTEVDAVLSPSEQEPAASSSSLDVSSISAQQTVDGNSNCDVFEDALEAPSLENNDSASSQLRSQPERSEEVENVATDPEVTLTPERHDETLNQTIDPNSQVQLSSGQNAEIDNANLPEQVDDDEFGDFEEFGDFAEVSSKPATPVPENQETGGWAAFGSTPSAPANDGWAADFSAASDWPPASSETPPTTSSPPTEEIAPAPVPEQSRLPIFGDIIEDAGLWESATDVPESCSEEFCIDDLLGSFDCDKLSDTSEGAALKCAFDVWLALRIIEETVALKCQWTGSTTNACFLQALNMDPNLAKLRNTGLPVFAQQLGGSSLTPMAPGQLPSDVTSPVTATNGKMPTNSSSAHIDSLSVPPAQFDWRNSGLTNPLTGASVNAASTILDLDFLMANESSKSGNIASTLQKDLDALGLSSPTRSVNATDAAQKQPSLLDQLMSQSVAGGKKTTKIMPISELSVEAKALHDALPNLDYMHSSVLMFPVRRQDDVKK